MKFLYKLYFVFIRDFLSGEKTNLKIIAGPLKGYYWNVRTNDSRYFLGEYESGMTDVIMKIIPEADGFLDIGANAGYFSVLVSRLWPDKRVEAVEPFPRSVLMLKENISRNSIDNISVNELAISGKNGTIQMSNSTNLAANTVMKESFSNWGVGTIEVPSRTLDFFATEKGITGNWVTKIDVEGAELELLKGGESFLKKNQPILLLATHDCHISGIEQKCLDFLAALGYTCEEIPDKKIDGQRDYLCTPTH